MTKFQAETQEPIESQITDTDTRFATLSVAAGTTLTGFFTGFTAFAVEAIDTSLGFNQIPNGASIAIAMGSTAVGALGFAVTDRLSRAN